MPIDRYNSDNLTMLRGANAILFGIGSPSGIVGASTKRAQLSRHLYSVRFVTDDYGTLRGELDVNTNFQSNRIGRLRQEMPQAVRTLFQGVSRSFRERLFLCLRTRSNA